MNFHSKKKQKKTNKQTNKQTNKKKTKKNNFHGGKINFRGSKNRSIAMVVEINFHVGRNQFLRW